MCGDAAGSDGFGSNGYSAGCIGVTDIVTGLSRIQALGAKVDPGVAAYVLGAGRVLDAAQQATAVDATGWITCIASAVDSGCRICLLYTSDAADE